MFTLLKEREKNLTKEPEHFDKRRAELNEFIGFMSFFYLLPVLLLFFGAIPFQAHNIIIILMSLLMLSYVLEKGINFKDLGIRKDNLKSALTLNITVSLMLGFLLLFLKYLGLTPVSTNETVLFYLYYVLISAPVQEFIFRSLMFYELGLFLGKKRYFLSRVFLSAVIFGFAHVFFHSWIVLLATFGIGMVWGYLYYKKPNFYALAVSHAIVGAVAIFVGLI